jgi:hypothetical protein
VNGAFAGRSNYADPPRRRRPNRTTTKTEAKSPAKYHGARKITAQLEYSDDSAPSSAGNQYRAKAITSGAAIARAQVKVFDRSDAHATEANAEMIATTTAPDLSDKAFKRTSI